VFFEALCGYDEESKVSSSSNHGVLLWIEQGNVLQKQGSGCNMAQISLMQLLTNQLSQTRFSFPKAGSYQHAVLKHFFPDLLISIDPHPTCLEYPFLFTSCSA
jgi:hypothetical protein